VKILVWDLPTRLFHWAFAGSFVVAYLTGETESLFPLHVFAGLLILVLIAYRLVWGLIGSRYARFSSFLYSPAAAIRYGLATLSGKASRHVGHSPAGSWAIYGLLLLGAGAAVAGLTTLLAGESYKDIHEVLANGMLAVVAIHLVGVAVASLAHRENLPRAMVTGQKEGAAEQAIKSPRYAAAAILIALVVGSAGIFLKGYDSTRQTLTLPFVGQPLDLSGNEGEGHHGHDDDD
jgi:cytochrome b